MEVWPGRPYPLGATPGPDEPHFAVSSGIAEGITLCLFDGEGTERQIPLTEQDAGIWHGFVPASGRISANGYRVSGPYEPAQGLRCNPNKLLLDPYARPSPVTSSGATRFSATSPATPTASAPSDSAPYVPRAALVVADDSRLGAPMPRRRSLLPTLSSTRRTSRAFTQLPSRRARGAAAAPYAGLVRRAALDHLTALASQP